MASDIWTCSNKNPSWPKADEMISRAPFATPSAMRRLSLTGKSMSLSMPIARVFAVMHLRAFSTPPRQRPILWVSTPRVSE